MGWVQPPLIPVFLLCPPGMILLWPVGLAQISVMFPFAFFHVLAIGLQELLNV